MKKIGLYVLLLCILFMACKSSPPGDASAPAAPEADSASFTISQEMYDHTLAEVKIFVSRVNSLIENKDYDGWKNALSDEFFARISSPEFLESASKSALLQSKKIVLKTPNDYFLYVVVPSRSNSRVDEIEFIAANAVKVFYVEKSEKKNDNNTVTTEIRRLRLYELIKKSGDTWKITD